jgi:hypothetical protein
VELSAYIVWNVFITLVLAPLLYSIRQNSNEIQRIGILLNRTREELAREYVTKQELKDDFELLIDRIKKIDEKLDKLFERQ